MNAARDLNLTSMWSPSAIFLLLSPHKHRSSTTTLPPSTINDYRKTPPEIEQNIKNAWKMATLPSLRARGQVLLPHHHHFSKSSCGYLHNMNTCLLYSSSFPKSPWWFKSHRDHVKSHRDLCWSPFLIHPC